MRGLTARELRQASVLFVLYFSTAYLGLKLDAVSGFATLVWPPTGIALASLLLFGYRLWPGIALGAFLVNLMIGGSFLAALGIAMGNTLEAVAAAFLLRRYADFDLSMGRLRDVISFFIYGVVLSTLVSATLGILSLWFSGKVSADLLGATWRAWWVGDALGALIVCPFLLTWASGRLEKLGIGNKIEGAFLLVAAVTFAALVFSESGMNRFPLLFVLFPIMIWAALRFRQTGSTTVTLLISGLAVWGTAKGLGPFAFASLNEKLFVLLSYLAVLAVSGLILATAVSEKRVMDEAIQGRDEFIFIASHELKTPLTVLHLRLQLMEKLLTENPARGETASMLEGALKAARVLASLIDDLLDVTRIRTGKLALDKQPMDLAVAVAESVTLSQAAAHQKGSAISLRADPVIFGHWDPRRINQILANLLSNAIKYGEGKPIDVVVSLDEDHKRAWISVRDHGIGVPKEMQNKIFERFQRAVSGEFIAGLGLGLYIAKQLAEAHGGSIHLQSSPGEGSLFTVELPISRMSQ